MGPLALGHFLALSAALFCISVAGIILNRKNVIILLMSIELMLLSVNMNFVAFSRHLGDARVAIGTGAGLVRCASSASSASSCAFSAMFSRYRRIASGTVVLRGRRETRSTVESSTWYAANSSARPASDTKRETRSQMLRP